MMNFPFGTNGKFIILGVPILKHIRVYTSIMRFNCISKISLTGQGMSIFMTLAMIKIFLYTSVLGES